MIELARGHPHHDYRASAMGELCQQGLEDDPRAREEVRQGLSADVWQVRVKAIACAVKMFGKEVEPALEECLQDAEPEVRVAASAELRKMDDLSGLPVVRGIVEDKTVSASTRGSAARAMGHFGDCSVLELLRDLTDEPGLVKDGASAALQSLRSPCGEPRPREKDVAEWIRKLNLGRDPLGVLGTIQSHGRAAAPAVPAVIELLKSDDMETRCAAAMTLGYICSGAATADCVPALIALVDDPDRNVGSAAMAALGRIGPEAKAAVPVLREISKGHWTRSNSARDALEKIEGE